MYQVIDQRSTQALSEMEAFVSGHPKGHFLQSTLWPAVKPQWDWRGVLSRGEDGAVRGALSILIRRMPGGFSLLYAPRGPVCDVHDKAVMGELFDGARQAAKQCRGYLLQIDPDILSSDTEFEADMAALGFEREADSLNFEGIQPRFVFRLNVEGKTEEEVMAGFEQKTRYNVRLAVKKGVTTRFWAGDEDIPDEALTAFADIMQTTGKRDKFLVRSREYFANMLRALGKHGRLYIAYLDGQPISGAIASQYGDKTWYMYGASSNEHRNVMPNYLLQWEMIRWALEGGSRIYDFRGVSGDLSPENPLYGLYRFKKGFNGDFCEFCGQFTMVYRPAVARGMDFALKCHKKLRRVMANARSRKG